MIKVYNMDVLQALKQMPDESVDMQITSPPYWGLRDYGEGTETIWDGDENCEHDWGSKIKAGENYTGKVRWQHTGGRTEKFKENTSKEISQGNFCKKCGAWKGQLGLEPDFDLFIKHLCDVFDEVKRVLKKDGTCWINLGDTYFGGNLGVGQPEDWKSISTDNKGAGFDTDDMKDFVKQRNKINYMAKCLICVPERFAIEMINRGWILRNKIIWHKPNHMPTSVKDRFANSWEYLFMFSKSKKYYFDLGAVREPHQTKENRPMGIVRERTFGYNTQYPEIRNPKTKIPKEQSESFGSPRARNYRKLDDRDFTGRWGNDGKGMAMPEKWNNPKGKNPDDVIRFSSKEGNRSIIYGTKWSPKNREYNPLGKQPDDILDFWDITTRGYPEAHFAVFPEALVERPIKTTRKDAVIMDIFAGSGTTLKVARRLNRDSIGIEIKPDYCELIRKRLFGGNQSLFPDEFELITQNPSKMKNGRRN